LRARNAGGAESDRRLSGRLRFAESAGAAPTEFSVRASLAWVSVPSHMRCQLADVEKGDADALMIASPRAPLSDSAQQQHLHRERVLAEKGADLPPPHPRCGRVSDRRQA
jgi:hypothetical protein